MKFERLRLEQFKCFEAADLRLEPGVTVIHGLNGSGKSSLLEACFFALYGATALERTLEEIVTIGADEATVELWFTHDGAEYHVRRRIRVRDDRAQTVEAVLAGPEGTAEGARDVRRRIVELLRMDADAFLNCAYVRQGEVNKLINATPSERQDMLDELLQLGTLETYRERASDARVGVGRVRDDKRGALSQLEAQIEDLEEADLHETKNELETELAELREEIEHYEAQRESAVKTRDEAAELLAEYEDRREELEAVREEIESLETRIGETEQEREKLQSAITGLDERRSDLETELGTAVEATTLDEADPEEVTDRLEELGETDDDVRDEIESHRLEAQEHESEADRQRERADELEQRAETKREEATSLETQLAEDRAAVTERREKLDDLADRIAEQRAAFEDAPVDVGEAADHEEALSEELAAVREREAELSTALESAREDVDEAERLLEAGKCPECGQPVDGAPHVESLSDYRERVAELESDLETVREERETLETRRDRASTLADREDEIDELENRRESVEQLVAERESGFAETEDRIDGLREAADELETEVESARETAAEADAAAAECREAIADCNERRAELRTAREAVERVQSVLETAADVEAEIEEHRRQRAEKAALNDERRERLAEKRERRDELAADFDENRLESARTDKQRAAEYIDDVDDQLADLEERRDELTSRIGAVANELETLDDLRSRRDALAATLDDLESLYDEAERLQTMYADLRAELRRRNVETLERLVNETFDLVYENDAYARIELDGDYRMTVHQKDGETLDPDQLSGGERALFNLSLRCAIYRLLAEGIEGAAPMPPLILDEPTVFLDSGHVSQLVELIAAMTELGVEQILVVSHDEELVGAADDLVTVRTDATTNRSTVERVESADDRLLAEADD